MSPPQACYGRTTRISRRQSRQVCGVEPTASVHPDTRLVDHLLPARRITLDQLGHPGWRTAGHVQAHLGQAGAQVFVLQDRVDRLVKLNGTYFGVFRRSGARKWLKAKGVG